jgi:hypothetical protein
MKTTLLIAWSLGPLALSDVVTNLPVVPDLRYGLFPSGFREWDEGSDGTDFKLSSNPPDHAVKAVARLIGMAWQDVGREPVSKHLRIAGLGYPRGARSGGSVGRLPKFEDLTWVPGHSSPLSVDDIRIQAHQERGAEDDDGVGFKGVCQPGYVGPKERKRLVVEKDCVGSTVPLILCKH